MEAHPSEEAMRPEYTTKGIIMSSKGGEPYGLSGVPTSASESLVSSRALTEAAKSQRPTQATPSEEKPAVDVSFQRNLQ